MATTCLISPAERPPITRLGTVSSLPEKVGMDILWEGLNGLCGVQRKATLDLIASVRDGRLGKEIMQSSTLAHRFLVIEGQLSFSADGRFMNQHVQWTKRQQSGVELSIQRHGVLVLHTMNALDTCREVEYLVEWTAKPREERSSLMYRSNAKANGWGRLTDRDYAIHILSGIEGISKLAADVYDKYGTFPCRHTLSVESLLEIDKIGPKRARSIMRAFGAGQEENG